MSMQAATVEKVDGFSEHQVRSRQEWLTARQNPVNRAKELAALRDQLIAERGAWDLATFDELSGRHSTLFIKQLGYRLAIFVGIPLIVAVYLFLQLQKLPSSSLSYSLLSAIISLLFNFSSSALLKVF